MNFSAIALFVYNRPEHTKMVLDKLALNIGAKESELFIFCDGIKQNSSDALKNALHETRALIELENRFKKVIIYTHNENQGLANSIIFGVSKVLSIYDRVIVLEDDIVPEKGFLKYMNQALNMYQDVQEIGCIHAWNYTFKKNMIKTSTFLLRGADCWGWATWKRSWELFESDGNKLKKEIENNNLVHSFNRNGTHPFFEMLIDQINGKNDSWAIRWHASLFIANKFCLHPCISLVYNIGFDGSGTHCGVQDIPQKTQKSIKINKISKFEEDCNFFDSYKHGFGYVNCNFLRRTYYFFKKII